MEKEELESQGSVQLPERNKIKDAEWCFQFFDNKPVVFAFSKEGEEPTSLILEVQPIEGEVLIFKQNGMEFKLFPLPISEETKLEREKQKENATKN